MTSVYPEVIPEEYVFGIAAESIVGLVYLIASLVCLVPLLLILRVREHLLFIHVACLIIVVKKR